MKSLYEFKQDLYTIRENRRIMRSIRTSLANLEEEVLSSVFSGAIDYSQERVQKSHDPDSAIINAIMMTEQEKDKLKKQLSDLQEENSTIENLIYSQRGLGAEIVRLYFIEGETMIAIAKRLHYHRDTCYAKWNDTIKLMWEASEVNADGQ